MEIIENTIVKFSPAQQDLTGRRISLPKVRMAISDCNTFAPEIFPMGQM